MRLMQMLVHRCFHWSVFYPLPSASILAFSFQSQSQISDYEKLQAPSQFRITV